MEVLLGTLEARVRAAVALIASLRAEVSRLESELAAQPLVDTAVPVTPEECASLAEQVAHLQAERAVVRERIRDLIREIDAVSW